MDNKYYTPLLSEMFVGLEYEETDYKGGWEKNIFPLGNDYSNMETTDYVFSKSKGDGEVRVKYLDESDIKECGWEFIPDDSQGDGNQRLFDSFKLNNLILNKSWKDQEVYIHYFKDNNPRHLSGCIFEGDIMNKSELKFQMKRLHIG
jgi:hypothetical protein